MAKSRNLPNGQNRGRDTRLNPRVAQALVNALSAGNYAKTACQYVGISQASYTLWQHRGEAESARVEGLGYDPEALINEAAVVETTDGESVSFTHKSIERMFEDCPKPFEPSEWVFVVFKYHIDRAKASAEIRALTIIQQAMPDNWQAAGWYLERTRPDQYGRRERINMTGNKDGEPIKVETTVTVDELEARIREIRGGDDE